MPPLDLQQTSIARATLTGETAPPHPSSGRGRLERKTALEEGWWGHRFGIDTPYFATPLGWGEWSPVLYGEQVEDVVELAPALEGPDAYPSDLLFPDDGLFPT